MPHTKTIGALWSRQNKNGPYFFGKINIDGQEIKIVALYNKNKKNETHPTLEIYPKMDFPKDVDNSIL